MTDEKNDLPWWWVVFLLVVFSAALLGLPIGGMIISDASERADRAHAKRKTAVEESTGCRVVDVPPDNGRGCLMFTSDGRAVKYLCCSAVDGGVRP